MLKKDFIWSNLYLLDKILIFYEENNQNFK